MELWDLYRPDGSLTGQTLVRGEPVPAGLFHIVSDVVVKHADGTYLVTQRDMQKETYPGKFEAGASGCVAAGETPLAGALRELREETGIEADGLTFLFAVSNQRDALFFCYLCQTDCPKDSITLQEGETIAYRWLPEAEFMRFVQSEAFAAGQQKRWQPYWDRVTAF